MTPRISQGVELAILSVSMCQADANKIRRCEQQTTVGMCFSLYWSVRRGPKLLTAINNDADDNNSVQLKFQLAVCTLLRTFRKVISEKRLLAL
jgi:hypothetical protein